MFAQGLSSIFEALVPADLFSQDFIEFVPNLGQTFPVLGKVGQDGLHGVVSGVCGRPKKPKKLIHDDVVGENFWLAKHQREDISITLDATLASAGPPLRDVVFDPIASCRTVLPDHFSLTRDREDPIQVQVEPIDRALHVLVEGETDLANDDVDGLLHAEGLRGVDTVRTASDFENDFFIA